MSHMTDRRRLLLDSYRRSGPPMATAYLPAPSDAADARDRYEIRAKNCLTELADRGAGSSLLATVERALGDFDHAEGAALALVATDDDVVMSQSMFRPVSRLFVSLGPTPALLPLLESTQADVSHVAVLLDRVGADIWYRDDLGTAVETTTVTGDDLHIHRGHPGGWSQQRFQQIAENAWEDNAKTVVSSLADDWPDAEVVIVGGDVRAVGFFGEHLPPKLGRLITVDGSRAAGPEAFLDNADTAIRSVAAERLVAAIEEARDAIGEGRAVEGDQVLDLLGQGRIERLFVANDTLTDPRPTRRIDFAVPAWTRGDSGSECASTDGAVALAVATGATVTVVPNAVFDHALVGIVRGSTAPG